MSFIQIDGPNPFKKVVISLWFRIPQESITTAHEQAVADAAAAAADETGNTPIPPFSGIIPLMVFGPKGMNRWDRTFTGVGTFGELVTQTFSWEGRTCDWAEDFRSPITEVNAVADYTGIQNSGHPITPSFIGVDCGGATPKFNFRFQFSWEDSNPTVNLAYKVVNHTVSPQPLRSYGRQNPTEECGAPGECFFLDPDGCERDGPTYPVPTYAAVEATVWAPMAYREFAVEPEVFAGLPTNGAFDTQLNGGGAPGSGAGGGSPKPTPIGHAITADHWHHVILSIDWTVAVETKGINGPIADTTVYPRGTVTNAAKMYLAIDDVNLTGPELSYFCPTGNQLLTALGWCVMMAGQTIATDSGASDSGFGFTYDVQNVGGVQPSYKWKAPLFDMAKINLPGDEETTLHCEMAKLQIFTDVTLNTLITSNRRIFITNDGIPASAGAASDFFGKEPEVKLWKAGDWKSARNVGTAAPIPSDGVATGTILTYKPNPNLNGDQGT